MFRRILGMAAIGFTVAGLGGAAFAQEEEAVPEAPKAAEKPAPPDLRAHLRELRDKMREEGKSEEEIRAALEAKAAELRKQHPTPPPGRPGPGPEGMDPAKMKELVEKWKADGATPEEVRDRLRKLNEARGGRPGRGGPGGPSDAERKKMVEERIRNMLEKKRAELKEQGLSDEEIEAKLAEEKEKALAAARKRFAGEGRGPGAGPGPAGGGPGGPEGRGGELRKRIAEMREKLAAEGLSDEEIQQRLKEMREQFGGGRGGNRPGRGGPREAPKETPKEEPAPAAPAEGGGE